MIDPVVWPAVSAAFLASVVEVVEAFTIVLAVGTFQGCQRAASAPLLPGPAELADLKRTKMRRLTASNSNVRRRTGEHVRH